MEPLDAPAQNRPTDSAGLLRCHGVGEAKLDAYGSAFLTAIRGWNANGQCPE
jgi:ATP-dependent DNA helicase RecQ